MDLKNKIDVTYKRKFLQLLVFVLILMILFLLARMLDIRVRDLTPSKVKGYLLSFGIVKAAIIYILIYTFSLRPFVPIPPTLYTLAGGFTFGPLWGTVFTIIGATLNATLCFFIARILGKDFVDRLSGRKLGIINDLLKDSGFKALLLVRTSPIGPPFDFVSYASGVLRISFKDYFFATLIGIIPATAVYSYFGGSISKGGWAILTGFFLVVVLALVIPWILKRRSRRGLSAETQFRKK